MAQPPKPTIAEEPYLFSFANADSNAARALVQREKYRDSVIPLIGPQARFNFWGEDYFFGRINNVGNASIVNETYITISIILSLFILKISTTFDIWRF